MQQQVNSVPASSCTFWDRLLAKLESMTTVAKPIQGIATAHSRNKWVLGCIAAGHCALDVPDFRHDRTARLATGACVKVPKPGSFPMSGHQRSGMGSRVHQFEAAGIWAGKAQTLRHALYPPVVSKQLSRPLKQPYSLLQTTQGHGAASQIWNGTLQRCPEEVRSFAHGLRVLVSHAQHCPRRVSTENGPDEARRSTAIVDRW
jgi:hypothetical protein